MNKQTGIILLMPALAVLLISSSIQSAPASWGRQVAKKDSLYNTIFVYQRGQIVTLRFGRRAAVPIQTQVNLDDLQQHMLEYTSLTFCGLLYQPEPKHVLVLGLGGGVIPRDLRHYYPDAVIDVAEIDGEIVPLAKEYFAFEEDDTLKVHVDDGRMFIKKRMRNDEAPKYDIIVLDAFNGDYIPFHLMTREFLEEVKAVLADDGVVVANVFSSNRLFDAEMATFLAVFGRCQVYMGRTSGNAMLISPGPKGSVLTVDEVQKQARRLQEKHRFDFNLISVAKCIRPNIQPDPKARVLTDDRAPVNWLREQEKED